MTRKVLEEEIDTMSDSKHNRFFNSVENFYAAVVAKMVAKFPFGEKVLEDKTFMDPSKAVAITRETVLRLADLRFKVVPWRQWMTWQQK